MQGTVKNLMKLILIDLSDHLKYLLLFKNQALRLGLLFQFAMG
jgi:hypothetical protein